MPGLPAITSTNEAIKTLEGFDFYKSSVVSVGTSATAIPSAPSRGRKGLYIQNIHASQTLYIGGSSIPDIIKCPHSHRKSENLEYIVRTSLSYDYEYGVGAADSKIFWFKSSNGTNEYYAATVSKGDPSMVEPLKVYGLTSAGDPGAETALTNGSVSSLNDHEWDWGDGDTLGWDTFYYRDDSGSPVNLPHLTLLAYTSMPDTSSNYGLKITAGNAIFLTLSGASMIWGIASGATTTTIALEVF